MSRIAIASGFLSVLVAAVAIQPSLLSQAPAPARTPEFLRQRAEEFRQRSLTSETRGLAEPFKGITTNGQI
jgi:hypothetical protein